METRHREMVWYKDMKLLIGVILVITSFILGFFSKILFISKFYEPVYLITGLSVYAASWLMLFFGAFLIGWETVKIIQHRIHHHVRKTAITSYNYTKGIPRRGINYTKSIHRKFTGKNKNKSMELGKK